jgi:hypothetical protein
VTVLLKIFNDNTRDKWAEKLAKEFKWDLGEAKKKVQALEKLSVVKQRQQLIDL